MAIIRQRKRNLVLAMAIGIVVGIIPFGILGIYSHIKTDELKTELIAVKSEMSSRKLRHVYILKNKKQKGEELRNTDLIECDIYSKDEVFAVTKSEDLIGKKLKIDVGEMSVINTDMLYKEDISDDVRLHEYLFLDLHDEITEGSYIDIRIAFPNGEDYIVAEHKRVEKRNESSIYVYVNEEEILLLSSAKVDLNTYVGARVYAILYARDYQNPANKDYTANEHVCELAEWDPNMIKKVFTDEGRARRKELENNMAEFLSDDRNSN